MDAVLFVGHGSRDPEGNREVLDFINLFQDRLDVPIKETCFLEFEPPGVIQGMQRCIDRGATRVAVIPMMLLAAGHAKIHIPAAIDDMREKYPQVTFVYGRPIGVHEQVLDIMASRLVESGLHTASEHRDTAILVVGRGSSDPDANSDLFKMSRLLWERLKVAYVETAFIGVTSPLAEEGMERCIRLGAREVVILPYFLFTGVLIKRMEEMAESFRNRYPGVNIVLGHYFGFHPSLQSVFIERVNETLHGEVRMNCDMCQYRLNAMQYIDHHHDHDHGHDHHGHHHHHDHRHHDHHHHGHDHPHHHDHDHHHHSNDHHQHDHHHHQDGGHGDRHEHGEAARDGRQPGREEPDDGAMAKAGVNKR